MVGRGGGARRGSKEGATATTATTTTATTATAARAAALSAIVDSICAAVPPSICCVAGAGEPRTTCRVQAMAVSTVGFVLSCLQLSPTLPTPHPTPPASSKTQQQQTIQRPMRKRTPPLASAHGSSSQPRARGSTPLSPPRLSPTCSSCALLTTECRVRWPQPSAGVVLA